MKTKLLKKIIATLLALSLWYVIFAFITLELNPFNWAMWVRILTMIFYISAIHSNLND
jgi:hypothetical protein